MINGSIFKGGNNGSDLGIKTLFENEMKQYNRSIITKGGFFHLQYSSLLTIIGSIFQDSWALQGGGISLEPIGKTVTLIQDCIFQNTQTVLTSTF